MIHFHILPEALELLHERRRELHTILMSPLCPTWIHAVHLLHDNLELYYIHCISLVHYDTICESDLRLGLQMMKSNYDFKNKIAIIKSVLVR